MIDRRKALAALGTVGLGSLLAACSGDGDGSGAATTTAEVPTTSGTTATVQPQTSTTVGGTTLYDLTTAATGASA